MHEHAVAIGTSIASRTMEIAAPAVTSRLRRTSGVPAGPVVGPVDGPVDVCSEAAADAAHRGTVARLRGRLAELAP